MIVSLSAIWEMIPSRRRSLLLYRRYPKSEYKSYNIRESAHMFQFVVEVALCGVLLCLSRLTALSAWNSLSYYGVFDQMLEML